MSGPDGSTTKRDARREARRAQFQMQQSERHRQRESRIRRQRLQTFAIIGVSILLFLLVVFLIVHAVVGSTGSLTPSHHGSYTLPAGGASGLDMAGISVYYLPPGLQMFFVMPGVPPPAHQGIG